MGLRDRLVHAWNAFTDADQKRKDQKMGGFEPYYGATWGQNPNLRPRMLFGSDKYIITAIYQRLALDFSGLDFRHIRVDDNDRYLEDIDSKLNNCFKVQANIDQFARAFKLDMALTLFERGYLAVVPVDTTLNPEITGGYDIQTMRIGWITDWYPEHVRVEVWRQELGKRVPIVLPKKVVAIVENPLYEVMNNPSSTLKRLTHKLGLLDAVDEQSASGKLDLIIQLPYVVKSEGKRQQAEQRRKDIEFQLKGSQYGVAYTDGTEKITQLNRPAENNLMAQIEFLVQLLYTQLGLTPEIMNGTADEATMVNYYTRTIEPLADAFKEAFHATFLTNTARTQGQAIRWFRDLFKSIPISAMAQLFDSLSQNEIASSNEIRGILHLKPDSNPASDQLRNSNINPQDSTPADPSASPDAPTPAADGGSGVSDAFDQIDQALDDTFKGLGVPNAS
jgi:hypothetical protein